MLYFVNIDNVCAFIKYWGEKTENPYPLLDLTHNSISVVGDHWAGMNKEIVID